MESGLHARRRPRARTELLDTRKTPANDEFRSMKRRSALPTRKKAPQKRGLPWHVLNQELELRRISAFFPETLLITRQTIHASLHGPGIE